MKKYQRLLLSAFRAAAKPEFFGSQPRQRHHATQSGSSLMPQGAAAFIHLLDDLRNICKVTEHTAAQNYDTLQRSIEQGIDEKLQSLPDTIENLVKQRQYFKALAICDAYLQPFEKRHLRPTENLRKFYLYYADLLERGHDPENRRKAAKMLQKALEFFPNDQKLKERREDFEISEQIVRDINLSKPGV